MTTNSLEARKLHAAAERLSLRAKSWGLKRLALHGASDGGILYHVVMLSHIVSHIRIQQTISITLPLGKVLTCFRLSFAKRC